MLRSLTLTLTRLATAARWFGAAIALVLLSFSTYGQPTARPAGVGDDGWSNAFPAGTFGPSYETVRALAVVGTDVYLGGDFSTVGGVATGPVARWDGQAWSALGPAGATNTGDVAALAVVGSNLFAGGNFSVGGLIQTRVARWDGSTWSDAGGGISDEVHALAVSPTGELYAASSQNGMGGAWGHVYRWNPATTAWTTIGNFLGEVYALTVTSNGDVYAGGAFGLANGTGVVKVGRWDGTAWAALDTTAHVGVVDALATDGANVYAGYTTYGPVNQHHIMKWDGAAWTALGTGLSGGTGTGWGHPGVPAHGSIRALAVAGSTLYVGGDFTMANGLPAPHIARWDGAAWSSLGTGLNAAVLALGVSPTGTVYAGGAFTTVGDSSKTTDRFGAYTFRPTGLPSLAASATPPTLYPNPAAASAAVRLTTATPRTLGYLLDATGRTLRTHRTDAAGAATLDVRGLPPGLYLVRCGGQTQRLVVE